MLDLRIKRSLPEPLRSWMGWLAALDDRGRAWLGALWVLAVWAIAFFWNSGSVGLVDETEPMFSEAARQMTVTGDWITPYFNGATRFDKPPLIYWLTAIAYNILGVNEWAVRLPSGLAALVAIGLSFATLWRFSVTGAARQQFPWRPWIVGAIGAGTIAFSPHMIIWGRVGVSDMLLTGCISAALLSYFWAYASERPSTKRLWYLAFYVSLALAVLTKGPVGVVLPGGIVLAFALYLGELKPLWKEAKPLWGLLLVAVLSIPWFVLVILANGEAYIDSFFGYHNLDRFTRVVNQHSAPWFFYFIVVAWGFAPWSVYLPIALGRLELWRRKWWLRRSRAERLPLFAGAWFLGVFCFFTIAVTKLPSYVVPLMPAGGLLVALLWRDLLSGDLAPRRSMPRPGLSEPPIATEDVVSPGFHRTAIAAVVVMGILAIALGLQDLWLPLIKDPTMPRIRQVLEASGAITRGAIDWAIAAALGAVIVYWRRYRWLWLVTWLAGVVFFAGTIVPVMFALDSQRQLPLRVLAAEVVRVRQPDEELMMVGFAKPSVVFYTQQVVNFSQRATPLIEGEREALKINPNPKPATALLLGDRKKLAETKLDQVGQPIAAAGSYQLLRVDRRAFATHQPPIDPDD
jgi:4-amino-4-deoxy-L-arabinose transferase-like glycosyltransferase